jgi:glycosidase
MLLTAIGVPFIYYGEEIGMQGRKPDERIRTPMQWSPDGPAAGFSTAEPWQTLAEDWQSVNVASQAGDPASLLSTYRRSIAFRAAHPALARGGTLLVEGGAEPVIGWLRVAAGETLLVVVNVGSTAVTDYALSLDGGPLCDVTEAAFVGGVGDASTVAVSAPAVTPTGGFDGFRPIGTLQPRSGYVISLGTP